MRFPRTVLVSLLTLGTLSASAGVASAATKAHQQPHSLGTIVIGNEGFTESYIMQDIYGDLLTKAGYTVTLLAQSGATRAQEIPALESGKVDLVPDYAGSLLLFLNPKATAQAGTVTSAENGINAVLKPKGAVALPGTAGLDQNVFVVTQATQKKYGLSTLSSLKAHAASMVLGAPPECSTNYFCAPGLKAVYGLKFKQVKGYDEGGPLTVAAVKSGAAQVGELFSTESVISADKFVQLTDNKNLEPADHLIPVVRNADDTATLRNALAKVDSLLTTSELTTLDAAPSAGSHPSPATVASNFLKAAKLIS